MAGDEKPAKESVLTDKEKFGEHEGEDKLGKMGEATEKDASETGKKS